MMMRQALALCAVLVSLSACGGASRAGSGVHESGPYPVSFRRDIAVHTRWHQETTHRNRTLRHMTIANQPLPDENTEVSSTLMADAEALTVSDGLPSVVRYTVSRCDQLRAGVVTSLIRPGAVLLVTQAPTEDAAVVTIDGAPVSDQLRAELAHLVNLRIGDNSNDDAMFGTDRPRAVGERWYPDVAVMSRSLASSGFEMDPATSTASMVLSAREIRNGAVGSLIEGTLATSGMHMGTPPAGATLRESRADFRFRTFLPDDSSSATYEQSLDMTMRVLMDVPTPAGPASVVVDATVQRTRFTRPL